jgi:Protein of unknown function (DUF3489)
MEKSKRKVAPASAPEEPVAAPSSKNLTPESIRKPKTEGKHSSKQSRVITMLQSPAGATIAAVMKVTGWQQHSVRGFLAGTVRKRLRLRLSSKIVDGDRVYRVTGIPGTRSSSDRPSRNKH